MENHSNIRYPKIVLFLLFGFVSSFLISLFLVQLFAAGLFIMWLFESIALKKKSFDLLSKFIFVFGAIRIISIFFSDFQSEGLVILHKEILFYLVFIALNSYMKELTEKDLQKVLDLFIWAGVVVAVIGIVQFNLSLVQRAQSITSGYSTYSAYLLIILTFTLFRYKKESSKAELVIWLMQITVMLTGILISLGRVNIAIAALLFLLIAVYKKIHIKHLITLVLLTASLSYISFSLNDVALNSRMSNPGGLSDRDVLINGFLMIYDQHPVIGHGPLTFKKVFPLFEQMADKKVGGWHNQYIEIYIETGLIGLTSFFALIFAVFYIGKNVWLKSKLNKNIFELNLSIATAVAVYMLIAVTAGFIFSPILSLQFAFLITMLSGINNRLTLAQKT